MAFIPFSVPFHDATHRGDTVGPMPNRVLCLHGAGTSYRRRYDELRQRLASRGIGSTAFDFIGHGETGGDLQASSLAERLAQAVAVIRAQGFTEPFSVVGGSMSATTAIELTELFTIGKLVLTVPAVYTPDAHVLGFGTGFSKRIRQGDNWQESRMFHLLEVFPGQTLIVEAGNDTVIPAGLVDRLVGANPIAQRLTIPDAPHKIVGYLRKHPAEMDRVYGRIIEFLAE